MNYFPKEKIQILSIRAFVVGKDANGGVSVSGSRLFRVGLTNGGEACVLAVLKNLEERDFKK